MADEQKPPLVEWAKKQPKWQQHALRLISKLGPAEEISEGDKNQIKKILVEETKGKDPEFVPIKETDISSAITTDPKTYLKSLGPVSNIDKLASEQKPFDFFSPNGMTVIFGNNGSGKSGYARILKSLCSSHGEVKPLKGDATSGPGEGWEVNLTYAEKRSGEDESPKPIQWTKTDEGKAKSDLEYIPLERIAFFDSQVANTYVDEDRELFYLPPELRLYAELATLAKELKGEIEEKVESLEKQLLDLPKTTPGTPAHNVISKLEPQEVSELSQEEVASICILSDEEKQELSNLRIKEANTPEQQKATLEAAKKILIKLDDYMKKSVVVLSSEAFRQLLDNHTNYQGAKTEAKQGVAGLAAEMPINEGVGSDVWFEMFKSARAFAGEVYPDVAPPTIANAEHCVLCHQDLEKEARERLELFDGFINGALQTTADKAEKAFDEGLEAISSLPILDSEAIKQQLQQYAELSDDNKREVEIITTDLAAITSRLVEVNKIIKENRFDDLQALINQEYNLRTNMPTLIPKITTEENALDVLIERGNGSLSPDEQNKLSELTDKEQCATQKTNIENYFKSSKQINLLRACNSKLDTTPISKYSSSRSADLYSEKLKERYTNEINKFGLTYLGISVGSKASIGEQKVGTKIEGLRKGKKSEILSEGEQRAVALAGFLTEVNEVDIGHSIIFDDPVSSLDLVRKNQIAKRLVEEAKNRQVIIFTHDHSFLLALQHHCDAKNVHLKNQWICQKDDQWGITGDTAIASQIKSVDDRLSDIKHDIAALEDAENKGQITVDNNPNSNFSKRAIPIAIALREVWERAVEEIIFYKSVQRYSPAIQTQRLSRVKFDGGGDDYAKFYEGFSGLVNETPHDTVELSPKLLTTAELRENLQQLEDWKETIIEKRPKKDDALIAQREANRLRD